MYWGRRGVTCHWPICLALIQLFLRVIVVIVVRLAQILDVANWFSTSTNALYFKYGAFVILENQGGKS